MLLSRGSTFWAMFFLSLALTEATVHAQQIRDREGPITLTESTQTTHATNTASVKLPRGIGTMLHMLGQPAWPSGPVILNLYYHDPNKRLEQLIFQSKDYRLMKNEWRRFWFTDQPSHLTYKRIHGGIGP